MLNRKMKHEQKLRFRNLLASPIYRTGKSREIISNDDNKADSGRKAKERHTSLIAIGQGSCRETVGNNGRNAKPVWRNPENK
jgi:hypothetical protein